jgi:hypothetical protein
MAASISAPQSSAARTGALHWRLTNARTGNSHARDVLTFAQTLGAGGAISFAENPSLSQAEERPVPGLTLYAGEWEYMVGGGAATFDYNGDGFADMLLAGGTRQPNYRNASSRGGALKFEAEASGLELDSHGVIAGCRQ